MGRDEGDPTEAEIRKKVQIRLSAQAQHQLMAMDEETRAAFMKMIDDIAADPPIGTPIDPDDPILDEFDLDLGEGMIGRA